MSGRSRIFLVLVTRAIVGVVTPFLWLAGVPKLWAVAVD
jgi:hypothetical protein